MACKSCWLSVMNLGLRVVKREDDAQFPKATEKFQKNPKLRDEHSGEYRGVTPKVFEIYLGRESNVITKQQPENFFKTLSEALSKDLLGIPAPRQPTGSESALPFVIVADDAFPLQNNLMKPYPFRGLSSEQRIYNYRLSRARRVVENAFGILANRFRVFLSPLMISPENAEKVVLASCVLHNFLRERLHHATHRLEVLTLKLLMRERYAMEAGEQNKGTFNRFLFWAINLCITKELHISVCTPTGALACIYGQSYRDLVECDTIHAMFHCPVLETDRFSVNWQVMRYDDEIPQVSVDIFRHILHTLDVLQSRPILVACGDFSQQQPLATVDGCCHEVPNITSDCQVMSQCHLITLHQQFVHSTRVYWTS
eukprot:gene11148-20032_t